MILQKTTNYDQFVIFEGNRNVKKILKLENSLKRRNMLFAHPIHVSKEMVVIDGQHRLDVARRHGLDVYYIVDEEATIEDIKTLNQGMVNWSSEDFLKYYKHLDYPDYKFLDEVCTKYGLTINMIITKISKAKHALKSYKDGNLFLRSSHGLLHSVLSDVSELLECIEDSQMKKQRTREMFEALFEIATHKNYNHEQFIKNLYKFPSEVKNSMAFKRASDVYDALVCKVYNKSQHDKNRIKFRDE